MGWNQVVKLSQAVFQVHFYSILQGHSSSRIRMDGTIAARARRNQIGTLTSGPTTDSHVIECGKTNATITTNSHPMSPVTYTHIHTHIYTHVCIMLWVIKILKIIHQTNCSSLGLHSVYTTMWFWLLKVLQRKRTSIHRL